MANNVAYELQERGNDQTPCMGKNCFEVWKSKEETNGFLFENIHVKDCQSGICFRKSVAEIEEELREVKRIRETPNLATLLAELSEDEEEEEEEVEEEEEKMEEE